MQGGMSHIQLYRTIFGKQYMRFKRGFLSEAFANLLAFEISSCMLRNIAALNVEDRSVCFLATMCLDSFFKYVFRLTTSHLQVSIYKNKHSCSASCQMQGVDQEKNTVCTRWCLAICPIGIKEHRFFNDYVPEKCSFAVKSHWLHFRASSPQRGTFFSLGTYT